jgi:hypothetical protein
MSEMKRTQAVRVERYKEASLQKRHQGNNMTLSGNDFGQKSLVS